VDAGVTTPTLSISVKGNVDIDDSDYNQNLDMTNFETGAADATLTLGGNSTTLGAALTVSAFTGATAAKKVTFAPTAGRTLSTVTVSGVGALTSTTRGNLVTTHGTGVTVTINALQAVAGTLTHNGIGTLNIAGTTHSTAATGIVELTAAGTLAYTDAGVTVTNNGALSRTVATGSFTIAGSMTNTGNIWGPASTVASSLNAALAAEVNSAYVTNVIARSAVDNITVNNVFTNNTAASATNWTGNIYIGAAGTIAGASVVGNINFVGTATRTNDRNYQGATVIREGLVSNLTAPNVGFEVNQIGATTAQQAANSAPNGGVFMGVNARWENDAVQFVATAHDQAMSFGQQTAALANGRMIVGVANRTRVQLVSDVWVANAVLEPVGTTVKREIGPACFTFNSAGSISGAGVVLNCGVFTITNNTAGTIRAQLIAAGYNPDAVSVSVEVAIPEGQTINLTDQAAEGGASFALNGANWKGVTISNTQRNFVLRRGIVNLNDANLKLHGGLVFSGNGSDGSRIVSTFAAQATAALTQASLAAQGYVWFTNNTIGGAVPQSNIKFERDGVNHLADNFIIDRLKIERNDQTQVNLIDANQESGVPSTLVIRERFELLNSTILNINDNNVRYIGGTPTTPGPLGTITAADRLTYRRLTIASNEMRGTGYLDLGNNDNGADDRNTITVNGALSSGSFVLKTQLRQTGTAGQRDVVANADIKNSITRITKVGNKGITFVSHGSLNLGSVTEIDDVETFISGNARVQGAGVTFRGNLYMAVNNNAKDPSNARLELTGSNQVTGNLTLHNQGWIGTGTLSPNALVLSAGTGLAVDGDLTMLGTPINPISIARPARLTLSGSSTSPATITMGGNKYIQRLQLNRPGGAQYAAGNASTLFVNDLLLTDGTFFTGGQLSMYDLASPAAGAHLNGLDDPSFASSTAAVGFEALGNLSIVTRDRTATKHGQITRNTNNGNPAGPFGAYSSAAYSAAGGAPYTVQHVGSTSRYSGDELPGLVVVNGSLNGVANSTNSRVNRLVIDLATNDVEFELTKDLMVNNRLETLTGKLDIAQTAFLDIEHSMQWVMGHMVPSTDLNTATVIRFPNTSGNSRTTTTTALADGRYDLLYVSKQNVTTAYEFSTGAGVRDLTVITAGSTTAPIVVSLSENKELSGSLRVVSGTLNLNSKNIKVASNVAVDAKHNANDATMAVNGNGNARVSGWFPTRVSSETSAAGTSLNPYNYGVGTFDDGYGNIDHTNGTIEFVGSDPSYAVGYVQASTGSTAAGRGPVNYFKLPGIIVTKTGTSGARSLTFDIDQAFVQGFDQSDINKYEIASFTQNSGTTHLRPGLVNGIAGLTSDAPASGAETLEKGIAATPSTQRWEVVGNMSVITGDFYAWGATMTVGGNYSQGVASPTVRSVFYGGQNGAGDVYGSTLGRGTAAAGQTVLNFQVNGNFSVQNDKAADAIPNLTNVENAVTGTTNTVVNRFYLSGATLKVRGNYAFFGHGDVTSGIPVANNQRGLRGLVVFNGTGKQQVSMSQVAGAQPAAYKAQTGRAFFNNVEVANTGAQGGIQLAADNHMYVNASGVFTFTQGNVYTGATELVLHNNSIDSWGSASADRNNIVSGAVAKSGSNSFVQGNLRRFMSTGSQVGGSVATTGYIFPLGMADATNRFWRPMTLQFPQNLGQTVSVVASSSEDTEKMFAKALQVQGRKGSAENPGAFYTIDLTEGSDIVWNVKFENLPSLEPNIRLGAQGLFGQNNSDIDDMRIVTSSTTHSSG